MSPTTQKQLDEERRGFQIHRLVYSIVIPVLAIMNLTFVPEFLWFLFPMIGWGIGLTMHYLFGVRRLAESLETPTDSPRTQHDRK